MVPTKQGSLWLTALLLLGCGDDDGPPEGDATESATLASSSTSSGATTGSASTSSGPTGGADTTTVASGTAGSTSSDDTESDASGVSGESDSGESSSGTGGLGSEEPVVVRKTLLRDLLPDLTAPGGLVLEKVEGAAVLASGDVVVVTDNDGVDDHSGETQLLHLGALLRGEEAPAFPYGDAPAFRRIATFPVCLQDDARCDDDTETVAEITAASSDGETLVYTDGPGQRIGFVDLSDPRAPQALGTLALGGEPTSVTVLGELALVAVNTSTDFTTPSGALVVVDLAARMVVDEIPLDGQPDSIARSPAGDYVAIVVENERDEDLDDGAIPQLPAGSLLVVETTDPDPSTWTLQQVDLTGLAGLVAPTDPEPEFVDINEDGVAVVTLQENNAIALVELATASVVASFTAGAVDLTAIDTVEESPALVDLTGSLLAVPREPDGVAWISTTHFATADEGDLAGGSRTFTVFDTSGGVVYVSGAELEHAAVRAGHFPDARSENKGVEPESVEFGRYGDEALLFVASERAHVVYVYDVGGETPMLRQVLPSTAGPEGVLAIPSRNLLVASSETDARGDGLRAGITIYAYEPGGDRYPTVTSENRDDGTPIPWGSLSGLAAGDDTTVFAVSDSYYQRSRILTLDVADRPARIVAEHLVRDLAGRLAALPVVALDDPSVDEDHASRRDVFDEADLAALLNDDGTVNLDLEGIAVASAGGFWLVSEGAGTVGDPDEPVNSRNLLLRTTAEGVVERVVTLPEEVDAMQSRFGFEGVAESEGRVYVAFQRAWGEESEPRLGIYDPESETWQFAAYPLDATISQNGGWMGLSELTALGDGRFMVVERDNQAGPDAAVKRLYTFEMAT